MRGYNISPDRIQTQLQEMKKSKKGKSIKKVKTKDLGWKELLLRKRGRNLMTKSKYDCSYWSR